MFASSCLKIAQAAVLKQHMQATIRRLLSYEVLWMFVVTSVPRFGGCPPPREREIKLRRSDGHSEIPPRGAMLVLMLCDPLGREGLTSWGAGNDAGTVVWADTTAAHCGITPKYWRWKDTHAPFQNGEAHGAPPSQTCCPVLPSGSWRSCLGKEQSKVSNSAESTVCLMSWSNGQLLHGQNLFFFLLGTCGALVLATLFYKFSLARWYSCLLPEIVALVFIEHEVSSWSSLG